MLGGEIQTGGVSRYEFYSIPSTLKALPPHKVFDMGGTVSTRWFFPDWLSDLGVRASSLAARGLWMDMLSIAGSNKGKDHGFVVIAGRAPSTEQIARLINSSVAEVEKLLLELEENGVFSRDRRKIIYSRRMVRAEKNRGNGRLGGNPNLLKNKEKQIPVQLMPKAHIPEPEPEPEPIKESPQPPKGGSDWPSDYAEQFWKAYPRRTEKKAAMAKLDAIRKTGLPWATFMAGVKRYAVQVAGTEDRYIKHPTTWLNRGCWDDEYRKGEQSNGRSKSAVDAWDRLQRRIEENGGDAVREDGQRRLLA